MHPTRRALLIAPLAAALPWHRDARAQALSELRRSGLLRIGVLNDFPPFGSLNKDGEPVGFEVDIAELVGRHLSVHINYVPLGARDRRLALLDGRVDVIAAQFGITSDRAAEVAFATPHLLTDTSIIAARGRKVDQVSDLAGSRIGVVWGSPADFFIQTALGEQAEILRFDTDTETFESLTNNTVDAICEAARGANAYFAGHPADAEIKLTLFAQANAMAVRQDAIALRQWLNTFVFFTRQTGELNAIWEKWLDRKLPPLPTL